MSVLYLCRLFPVVTAIAAVSACGGGGEPPTAPIAPAATASPAAPNEAATPQPNAARKSGPARQPDIVREEDLTAGGVPRDPGLVPEIINLERLLAATSGDPPDRPAVLSRLAEAY